MRSPARPLFLLGPLLLLVSCAAAFAQDVPGAVAGAAGAAAALPPTATTGVPALDYVIGLGPIGALVWGAYMLGKGVTVTINHKHELSDETLDRIEKMAAARRAGARP